jgi:2,3-bisphosphoglycerate-independent phosphoglycerate mutase
MMENQETHQPHTAHTTNPVPLIYVGRNFQLESNGARSDIAPTMLELMGLAQPAEMNGRSLVVKQEQPVQQEAG